MTTINYKRTLQTLLDTIFELHDASADPSVINTLLQLYNFLLISNHDENFVDRGALKTILEHFKYIDDEDAQLPF